MRAKLGVLDVGERVLHDALRKRGGETSECPDLFIEASPEPMEEHVWGGDRWGGSG
jgi:hypothetical protein